MTPIPWRHILLFVGIVVVCIGMLAFAAYCIGPPDATTLPATRTVVAGRTQGAPPP